MAGERHDAADERDMPVDGHMARTDELTRPSRSPELEHRLAEVMERGRTRLRSSTARRERNEALIQRVKEVAQRNQASLEARAAETVRGRPSSSDEQTSGSALAAAEDLRRKIRENVLWLAKIEDAIANQNEDLASRRPERADDYLRIAQHARAEAERARERARDMEDRHER